MGHFVPGTGFRSSDDTQPPAPLELATVFSSDVCLEDDAVQNKQYSTYQAVRRASCGGEPFSYRGPRGNCSGIGLYNLFNDGLILEGDYCNVEYSASTACVVTASVTAVSRCCKFRDIFFDFVRSMIMIMMTRLQLTSTTSGLVRLISFFVSFLLFYCRYRSRS